MQHTERQDEDTGQDRKHNTLCEFVGDLPRNQPTYSTILTINIKYAYADLIFKEVTIRSKKIS